MKRNRGPMMVELICGCCGKKFERLASEVKRCRKRGIYQTYCSNSCSGKIHNIGKSNGVTDHLCAGNRRDMLTPFRWFIARARNRDKETNLSSDYLKDLWERQRGICPLSGASLLLPDSTSGWINGINWRNASLDRIDNSIRYRRGNVRFVSVMANIGRGTFSDKELIEFCQAVANKN